MQKIPNKGMDGMGGRRQTRLLDDFLDATDDSVVEHDLYAVRMVGGVGENLLNDAFREFPCALVLLFYDADFHSRLNLSSDLAVHGFIMAGTLWRA